MLLTQQGEKVKQLMSKDVDFLSLISVWPSWQATESGVAPSSLAWFTFAPAAISAAAVSVWPLLQAM